MIKYLGLQLRHNIKLELESLQLWAEFLEETREGVGSRRVNSCFTYSPI